MTPVEAVPLGEVCMAPGVTVHTGQEAGGKDGKQQGGLIDLDSRKHFGEMKIYTVDGVYVDGNIYVKKRL